MKKIIRLWFIYLISLKVAQVIIPSIVFSRGWQTLFVTAISLTVFELAIKPIAKILLIPINILTLGLTRWVVNIAGLYIITVLINDFAIGPYSFPGLVWEGFTIPPVAFSMLATYFVVSLVINLLSSAIRWLLRK